MKALVTGGAGFVGTNLIKRLLKEGYEVISLDNYSTGLYENHVEGCTYLYKNLGRGDINESIFEGVDVVFHMAARARIQPSWDKPAEYFRDNAMATIDLLDICFKKNIEVVYAGSSSHHSGKYMNPYTFSKDIGEEIVKMYWNTYQGYNSKMTIARFYNVYGPHQIEEGEMSTLIGRWMGLYKKGKKFTIYGNGEKRRSFTHVDDIVEGLFRIHKMGLYGEVYELGYEKDYSVNEIAEAFWGKNWKKCVNHEEGKKGEAQVTRVSNSDIKKAKSEIGLEIKNDVLDYIYSFKKRIKDKEYIKERLDKADKIVFGDIDKKLSTNEKKVLEDLYGKKEKIRMREDIDLDNDIDKMYKGIIQEDLPDYPKDTPLITTAEAFGEIPSIDAFTNNIKLMREKQEEGNDPFIYWT